MTVARILLDEAFAISSRYRVVLRAFHVPASKKFPQGVKAKYEKVRVSLPVKDYNQALDAFFEEVERIVKDERD